MMVSEEVFRIWEEEDREAREIHRREANWEFINKQLTRIKAALIYFIETGDRRGAAKVTGMTLDEFNELRIKANISVVT